MANINRFPSDDTITDGDRLLGTSNRQTANFSVKSLSNYVTDQLSADIPDGHPLAVSGGMIIPSFFNQNITSTEYRSASTKDADAIYLISGAINIGNNITLTEPLEVGDIVTLLNPLTGERFMSLVTGVTGNVISVKEDTSSKLNTLGRNGDRINILNQYKLDKFVFNGDLEVTGNFDVGDIVASVNFGDDEGEVASWAEGNSAEQIPANKLTNAPGGDYGDNEVNSLLSTKNYATTSQIPTSNAGLANGANYITLNALGDLGTQDTVDLETQVTGVIDSQHLPDISISNVYADDSDTLAEWIAANPTANLQLGDTVITLVSGTWVYVGDGSTITETDFEQLTIPQDNATVIDGQELATAKETLGIPNTFAPTNAMANVGQEYTQTEKDKVGYLTVTQNVDLDTLETTVANINSYPSGDSDKVGLITVTSAINLDDEATNIDNLQAAVGLLGVPERGDVRPDTGTFGERFYVNADYVDTSSVVAYDPRVNFENYADDGGTNPGAVYDTLGTGQRNIQISGERDAITPALGVNSAPVTIWYRTADDADWILIGTTVNSADNANQNRFRLPGTVTTALLDNIEPGFEIGTGTTQGTITQGWYAFSDQWDSISN